MVTVALPVKSLDLVVFEIEIATSSDFFLEATIVLNRFSYRLVKKTKKEDWKVKKIVTKSVAKTFKI